MKLYSIGVGPGDKEDITIKAARRLGESPVVFVPVKQWGEKSFAYDIAKEYINQKAEIVELCFPMSYDLEKLDKNWKENARIVREKLEKTETGAFIVIGDVTMYSTYMYIDDAIKAEGVEVELIPGITSFSKVASLLGIPLAKWDEGLAIVPATRDSDFDLDEIFEKFQNIVIMKPSHNPENIVKNLKKHKLENNFTLVYKAGAKEQEIYTKIEEIEKGIPYLSTMLIKKSRGRFVWHA
jgi:precorrin-2/cobalt-factor-2 C20-methyltransferase